jgi:hypothetical protein
MLNVKSLTDTLSRMELPQLQQYAALHKNDPYVVSLALSIANQKKQMSAAQAGQAGMQPQPKVVDQALAQMIAPPQQMAQAMPEDVGIGQLPAQNMQRLAEGGIVAFDEGGEVPGYAGGLYNASQVPSGAIIMGNMYQDPETGEMKYIPGSEPKRTGYEGMTLGDAFRGAKKGLEELVTTPQAQKRIAEQRQKSLEADRAKNMGAVLKQDANLRPTPAMDPRLLSATPAAETVLPAATDTTGADTAGAGAAQNRNMLPPSRPPVAASAAPAAAKPTGIAALPTLSTTAKTAAEARAEAADLSDDAELRKKLEANETFTTQAYDKLLGDYNKKISEMPEAYKGYEERLKKEEAEASTDKDKALGMAIFQAGLGMMAGTSQYGFENISKGALAGLDNYQSALKDLKKAQRERDKAFADIEAARLAEKRGDIKAQTELQAKGIEALGTAKNRTVEGIAKIFDVDTRTATGIFETSLKDKAQNERTIYSGAIDLQKQREADAASMARTNAQLSAPSAQERMYRELGGKGGLEAGLRKYSDLMGPEAKGDAALVANYIKNPMALKLLEQTDPMLAAQVKQKIQLMMLQPQSTPTGPVRE